MTNEELIAQQDQLRTARQFISLMGGLTGQDQSLSGTDIAAVNASGQFSNVGPYGTSIEGQPIMTYSSVNGMTVAPVVVLVGLAIAAFIFLK